MKRLPLYPTLPAEHFPIAKYEPLEFDGRCAACSIGASNPKLGACLRPEGSPGGLYVLGSTPLRLEETIGRPFSGESGKLVRRIIGEHWTGDVALDYAIRCAPGQTEISDGHMRACSHFLATAVGDVKPARIITIGATAAEMFMGFSAHVYANERSYSFSAGVPVFHLPEPINTNRFHREAFEKELIWALTADVKPLFHGEYAIVRTKRDAATAVYELKQDLKRLGTTSVVYDVETYGRPGNKDFRVLSLAAMAYTGAHEENATVYVWTKESFNDQQTVDELEYLFSDQAVTTQNGKYDELAMAVDARLLLTVPPADFDTRLVRKILDTEAAAKLEVMGFLVGLGGHKGEADTALSEAEREMKRCAKYDENAVTPSGKPKKQAEPRFDLAPSLVRQLLDGEDARAFSMDFIDEDILYRYNARDVWTTNHLRVRLEAELEADPRLKRVWTDIVMPANHAITRVERVGFPVDKESIKLFADYCATNIALNQTALAQYGSFNPASPKQVAEFVYDKLKLKNPIRDKPARSTDKEVLAALGDKHPAMRTLLEYRRFDKLNGTYAEGMLPYVRDDGRIHASYLIDGTQSGRMSCSNPNLQNIPRSKGSPDAKLARGCFIAPPGYVMLEADFSQLELRIAAMLARDEVMIEDFRKGIDIHAANARICSKVAWNIPLSQWDAMTKDERDPYRSKIKSGTFGKLYGKSVKGLAKQLKCSVDEAQYIVDQIWGRYKVLDAWTKQMVREARKTGETWTWWDGERARRRYIWGIAHPDEGMAAHFERVSYNNAVQGTASEFCLNSVTKLWEVIDTLEFDAQIVGTVHDSIISIVRENELKDYARAKQRVMTGWNSEGVPIEVDMKSGSNWGDLVDFKLEAA